MRKLPDKYQKIYKEFYINYSTANSFFRKLSLLIERWYHVQAYKAFTRPDSILEIGCGNLNHIKYERSFNNYDVVEPKEYLISTATFKEKKSIRKRYSYIEEIPDDKIYDKIIAIAVLEHIDDLDNFLNKLTKHLHPNGRFIIEIPAEGEFLWWLGWRLTTGVGFWLKYRLDYGVIVRYEHINNAEKIFKSIKKYFLIENVKSFPFNLKNGRLYIHIVCKNL